MNVLKLSTKHLQRLQVEKMSKMISVTSGFQYSININYDINNNEKIKNFIPTNTSLKFIEEILFSTAENATDRARVLVGPYGKGKSHMVLTTMALLMKRDRSLFLHLNEKIINNKRFKAVVEQYYSSEGKILPVIISGSATSIPQSFLLALESTLRANNLLDIMPDTNYKAAIKCIYKWKNKFPTVFDKFKKLINDDLGKFIDKLSSYDIVAYQKFEVIYPELSAGAIFNPFVGFDITELYESVLKGLKGRGYSGIYVIYDEFSKYLEANIKTASVSDMKMLQDFAEKCNRSQKDQLHLLLICHKEISNYIDVLPKEKTDGWRGVSDRFKHIHLSDDFSQTYDIMETVINHDVKLWSDFTKKYRNIFSDLIAQYINHQMFSTLPKVEIAKLINECYPLHPTTSFILPRLSEKIAQNERTLFTFLSADSEYTLSYYLKNIDDKTFNILTPDYIYDYFAPLMEKEIYTSEVHKNYVMTQNIIEKIKGDFLQTAIVKVISLIYMVEQFDSLPPNKEEILNIFSIKYPIEKIEDALDKLIKKEYVIYLKRSNGYLQLKQSSGVDIDKAINDSIQRNAKVRAKDILNEFNFDRFMYPAKYNDDREMIRYFDFIFIDAKEINENINWNIKREGNNSDGTIYAILPSDDSEILRIASMLYKTTSSAQNIVCILPNKYRNISKAAKKLFAVNELRENAVGDNVLYNEYDIIYDDLYEVIHRFIQSFTRPEMNAAKYYYLGNNVPIRRKAELSALLSAICEKVYNKTPIINNEVINKDEITAVAINSRAKVLNALLRSEVDENLGLIGYGQDVSIMRSVLLRTGILQNTGNNWELTDSNVDHNISVVLHTIEEFIVAASEDKAQSFADLYAKLRSSEFGIGLRKGVIPIFIAVILHKYKNSVQIYDRNSQVKLNADTLQQINAQPNLFCLKRINWTNEKTEYIDAIDKIFGDYINDAEKNYATYDHVAIAIKRWYLALPKFSKELKADSFGLHKEDVKFLRCIRNTTNNAEFLFKVVPDIFGCKFSSIEIIKKIADSKNSYDQAIILLAKKIEKIIYNIFYCNQQQQASLQSVILDWCDKLHPDTFSQLFSNETAKFLTMCKNISGDANDFVEQVAQLATGLRIIDWDDKIYAKFKDRILLYKDTAEAFNGTNNKEAKIVTAADYSLAFIDDEGKTSVKRFAKVSYSPRAKLLRNSLAADLAAMGQAISDGEKRQVLMDLLQKLC